MSGKPLHTPGPWAIAEWPDAKGNFIVRTDAPDAKPFVAALVPFPSGLPNARLIAAAPDMLAALREAESILAGLFKCDIKPGSPRAMIRAAIAKAEG